jgi:murein DD-endopeptidase MepM/ murein hydrolase activator NlpD
MKHIWFFLFIGFFFTAYICAQSPVSAQIKYAVIPENPRPGEPVTIAAAGGVKQAVLSAGDKQLSRTQFFTVPDEDGNPAFITAVLTVPSTAIPGTAAIRLDNEEGTILEIPITITDRKFISDIIQLDETLTGIRTDPDPRKTAEAEELNAILSTTGKLIYHSGNFIQPVSSVRRTSFFGDRRIYKYSNGSSGTSIHAGIDFGIPTGTRVVACGSGRVVLARMRIVTGYSVIIEHGPGIYSLYYHLDKIEVNENSVINTGTLLGLSGATGLATGPHLHWEVRINEENTDPDAFLTRSIIDKNLIISKINM